MASLKRIELLAQRLNYKEPAWIRGYKDNDRDNHLSGSLREASDAVWGGKTGVAHEVLTDEQLALMTILSEAAEMLDDAHEEWLNLTLAARDLVGDVEAMKIGNPDEPNDDSNWFGPFTESYYEEERNASGTHVEWPNLETSQEVLCQVLAGKLEYKL